MTSPPLLLADILDLIQEGSPVPQRYRSAVCAALRADVDLDRSLYTQHYVDHGAVLSKSVGSYHSAYHLAGVVFSRSPSAIEHSYRRYRHLLESRDNETDTGVGDIYDGQHEHNTDTTEDPDTIFDDILDVRHQSARG